MNSHSLLRGLCKRRNRLSTCKSVHIQLLPSITTQGISWANELRNRQRAKRCMNIPVAAPSACARNSEEMGAALGRTQYNEAVVPSKEAALPKFFIQDGSTNTDDDSSSSALINAADEEPSECFVDAEERLQIAADGRAWGASKMLCCFTSGGSQFQSLGSPKFGSMLWQSTGGFKFLTRTLSGALLPPIATDLQGRLTVVLDLDETLVHSSFVPVPSADFVASVPVEGEPTDVWVYKRPFLDFFMTEVAAHFEVVIFTASLATYADVVLDILDQGSMQHRGDAAGAGTSTNFGTSAANPGPTSPRHHPPHYMPNYNTNSPDFRQRNSSTLQAATEDPFASGSLTCVPVAPSEALVSAQRPVQHTPGSVDCAISASSSNASATMARESEDCSTNSNVHFRLYRGSCVRVSGSYIKDLSRLGRPLARTVIVDNSPASYMWNPESAIPSVNFIDDKSDDGLLKILEVLMHLKNSTDVRRDLPGARAAAGYHVPMC